MGILDSLRNRMQSRPVVRLVQGQWLNRAAVMPDNTPLFVRRGWRKKGNSYHGYYRTRYGAWRGEIHRRGDKFNVYIFKPPIEQMQNHSRWRCIHQESGNKWRIDLAINPKGGDVDSIVFFVERLIHEAFRS